MELNKYGINPNTAVCFTGHRELTVDYNTLYCDVRACVLNLYKRGFTDFIVGGALGFDTLAATVIYNLIAETPELNIRYHIFIPCDSQTKSWSEADKKIYDKLLRGAASTHLISQSYSRGCMFKRNQAMVDSSAVCIACYTQYSEKGGTTYTVKYAISKGKKVIFVPLGNDEPYNYFKITK